MGVAFVALLVALSRSAVALPGLNSVDSGDIKNNAVRSKDIRNGDVRSGDVRENTLTDADVRNDSLNGGDINESTLRRCPRPVAPARQTLPTRPTPRTPRTRPHGQQREHSRQRRRGGRQHHPCSQLHGRRRRRSLRHPQITSTGLTLTATCTGPPAALSVLATGSVNGEHVTILWAADAFTTGPLCEFNAFAIGS